MSRQQTRSTAVPAAMRKAIVSQQQQELAPALASVRFRHGDAVQSLLLSPDLPLDEAQACLSALFGLEERVTGVFAPRQEAIFPFAVVARQPHLFREPEYTLVLERSGIIPQSEKTQRTHTAAAAASSRPAPTAAASSSSASASASAAFHRAQHLARLAAASPSASDLDDSREDLDDSDDLSDANTLSEDDPEESFDEASAREAAEDAQFELAIERAMESALQGSKAAANVMRNGLKQIEQSQSLREAARTIASPSSFPPQRRLAAAPAASSRETERQMQDRLIAALDDNDGSSFAPSEDDDDVDDSEGSANDDEEEANASEQERLRESAWQREREQSYLAAESRVLAAERAKLDQQRVEIADLRAEQTQLQQRQRAALGELNHHHNAQHRLRAKVLAASQQKAHAATALKEAMQRGARYDTFDRSEEEDNEEKEDEEDEEEAEESQQDDEEEEVEEEEGSEFDDSGVAAEPEQAQSGGLVLSSKELLELEDLQVKTGFASITPSQLFALFRTQEDADGNLDREAFTTCANRFVKLAGVRDEASKKKAILVLQRIFDLFDTQGVGRVEFAAFATGLSILVQGDRAERVQLAFSAFDRSQSGYLSLSSVERYLECFFTVTLDLSVSLQQQILVHTDCQELARATARQCFNDCGRSSQIAYAEFKRWYEAQQPQSTADASSLAQESEEEVEDSAAEGSDEFASDDERLYNESLYLNYLKHIAEGNPRIAPATNCRWIA